MRASYDGFRESDALYVVESHISASTHASLNLNICASRNTPPYAVGSDVIKERLVPCSNVAPCPRSLLAT